MTESPISVSELLTDPAGVPRARAVLQRAEWAARAFARYDKATVDAVVRAASAQTCLASGCGLTTTTLRVIRASRHLKNTVATGFVDGVSASTTPAGRGTSTILASASIRGVT